MNDYNYLPLDDHTLGFDQVQNYLQHKQHVSITFRAHEKIETCRNYLDKKLQKLIPLSMGSIQVLVFCRM